MAAAILAVALTAVPLSWPETGRAHAESGADHDHVALPRWIVEMVQYLLLLLVGGGAGGYMARRRVAADHRDDEREAQKDRAALAAEATYAAALRRLDAEVERLRRQIDERDDRISALEKKAERDAARHADEIKSLKLTIRSMARALVRAGIAPPAESEAVTVPLPTGGVPTGEAPAGADTLTREINRIYEKRGR